MLHVIIINFNSSDDAARCIASLDLLDVKIHLVDNASTSPGEIGNLESISHRDQRVSVSANAVNLGFGAAVNKAIASADLNPEDIVWILNPDTLVSREATLVLVDALEEHPRALVSPCIMTGSLGQEVWFGGGRLDRRRGVTHHLKRIESTARYTEATFLTGTAIMTRASTWDVLGGFRDDLFLYWEDADLSLRANELGIGMWVANEAQIWHAVGGSTDSAAKSTTWYYFMLRNRIVVCARDRWDVVPLIAIRGWELSARLIVRALREPGIKLPRLVSMWQGIRDGYRYVAKPLG